MMRRFCCAIVAILIPCSLAAAPTTKPDDLEARLDAIVTEMYPNADEPGVAVIVVAEGKPVLRKGYGMANRESGATISPDMIFRIGSVTKQFTAVAILQLVQRGKVKLDDPITAYVPNLDMRGQTITIEHLLTHTSGLPNYTAVPNFDEVRARRMSPREIVALVDDRPLDFQPGAQMKYSNTGYVLLGMVIEKATGQSYADYMREHVFEPADMTDTRYGGNTFPTARHARGYERPERGDAFQDARPLDMTQPYAAGAIESTVDDLWHWTRSLREGKLVDPRLLERAWTPYTPSAGKSDYGYGWFVARDPEAPGERWVRHGGGINGFTSSTLWIPERGVFVAVLSNALGGQADPNKLARRLALEAVGRPPRQRVAITLDEKTLDQYLGVYEISPRFRLTVTRQGQRLFVQGTNQEQGEVFAEAQGKFFSTDVDAQFEFHVEGDRATSLTLYQRGRSIDAKRVGD